MTAQIETVTLIPREEDYPIARFLSEEEFERYKHEIERFEEMARRSLNILRLNPETGEVEGSNLWVILLLNQIGIRTATLPELDRLAELSPELLREHYADAREVILRSDSDGYPNHSLTRYLARKAKERNLQPSPETPIIIRGLRMRINKKSTYGLALKVTDETEMFHAPDFSYRNDRRRFTRINPDYSIDLSEKGERAIYTSLRLGPSLEHLTDFPEDRKRRLSDSSRLCRLILNMDLGLESYWTGLDGSRPFGRVVVIETK